MRRVRHMSLAEVAVRVGDVSRQTLWRRRQDTPTSGEMPLQSGQPHARFGSILPMQTRAEVPVEVAARVVRAADAILSGHWTVFGVLRPDIADPDWFWDPVTGVRAPSEKYAFDIDHRDERITGNIKSVWEVSRHHHLTVLAAAYWLTGDERYAVATAGQLRSWWTNNPFLSGVHWTSGIELGIRLLSWVWIRRLLDPWVGVRELFEEDPVARRQIWCHQAYLAGFQSRGSSGNNHAIAEQSGRFAAACAFPWFRESKAWRIQSAARLEQALRLNTFRDGLNRELASDYHGFVLELALVAAAEGDAAGHALPDPVWRLLSAGLDAAAAVVDSAGRPPRQGDGDDGRALVMDDPSHPAWDSTLDLGGRIIGRQAWWPTTSPSMVSVLVAALASPHQPPMSRPVKQPDAFEEGGLFLLRSRHESGAQIWCRCDCGPHGFGSMAAHGHADALSIEVRVDGVDILADPGTYCYHGEPQWRGYFRSTRGHNTIEVDGQDQSAPGGPFMWRSTAPSQLKTTRRDGGDLVYWSARHDGYRRLADPVTHEREVSLHEGTLGIVDQVVGSGVHELRLTFHVGPQVKVRLDGCVAELSWPGERVGAAELRLPSELAWTAHQGETDPPLGWYSPGFGEKVPSTTLVGVGSQDSDIRLRSELILMPRWK